MKAKEYAMANQEQPKDGMPRQDGAPGGNSGGNSGGDSSSRGTGPGKVGLTSDRQPDLVPASGVNERDHGAAEDQPMGGGALNFDDDDMAHPRGRETGKGGTWEAQGGDSGKLGHPAEILSDRNGPSDPDNRRK